MKKLFFFTIIFCFAWNMQAKQTLGVPKINLNGIDAGKKIILRFAAVKYPKYKENIGMLMLENIRAAMAQGQRFIYRLPAFRTFWKMRNRSILQKKQYIWEKKTGNTVLD
jgi:hypothetical protein